LRLEKALKANLEAVDGQADAFDKPTSLLIFSAADLRAPSNVRDLVRLLPGCYTRRTYPVGSARVRIPSFKTILARHPAAVPLGVIGIPAVKELCQEVDRLGATATNDELVLIGSTVRSILNWHTRSYLEWHRENVGLQSRPFFDRLLALDVVRDSGPRAGAGGNFGDAIRPSRGSVSKVKPRPDNEVMLDGTFGEPEEKRGPQAAVDVAISEWRSQVDSHVLKVVNDIPKNSLTLTSEQIGAIEAAGRYQVDGTVSKLMSLCMVRLGDNTRPREPDNLRSFPAARALARMGWSASFAIRKELQSGDHVVPPERLLVYAMILREVWAGYAEEFVRIEHLEAIKPVDGSIYEKLRATVGSLK
jgi:hypothetical protein